MKYRIFLHLLRNSISALFLLSVLGSCASEVTPMGGPKDENPPKVVSASPANQTVGFSKKTITIHFDKFVELENVMDELVVSPPQEQSPEVTAHRRSLKIKLHDELEKNTTYTFSFGNAIKGYREGNVLSDYHFVFSTGSYIDSGYVTGNVAFAFNNQPAKGVKILLHRDLSDSAVFNKRPVYYARTDQQGNFTLRNLQTGKYHIFALKDQDGSYKYTHGDEFAFYQEPIKVEDSLYGVNLTMFKEPLSPLRLNEWKYTPPGILQAEFNRQDPGLEISSDAPGGKKFDAFKKWIPGEDSLYIWFRKHQVPENLFLHYDGAIIDTLRISHTDPDTLAKDSSFKLLPEFTPRSHIPPGESISFQSSAPMKDLHKEKIKLLEDSKKVLTPELSWDESHTILYMSFPRKYDGEYQLLFEKGALCDIYNRCNDSLYIVYTTRPEEDFGIVHIQVEKNVDDPVLLQLVNDDEVVYQKTIQTSDTYTFENVAPGHYYVKGIVDRDHSGNWTSGRYKEKRQPERVYFLQERLHVRANWELRDYRLIIGEPRKENQTESQ